MSSCMRCDTVSGLPAIDHPAVDQVAPGEFGPHALMRAPQARERRCLEGVDGAVAGRIEEPCVDMQTAVVEVQDVLGV